MPKSLDIVCPTCHQPLEEFNCQSCKTLFPSLSDWGIRALFKHPKQALSIAYNDFHHTVENHNQRITNYTDKIKQSDKNTQKSIMPLIKALHDNQALFKRWRDSLNNDIDIPNLLNTHRNTHASTYGYNFNYLARDWCKTPESTHHLNHLINAMKPCRDFNLGETALFLGAGTSRLACEISQFHQHSITIENSLGQIIQFLTLLQEDISFWEIQTSNFLKKEQRLTKQTASIEESLKPAARSLKTLWASASHIPLADNSVDCIYSIYFSDVLPLDKWLSESKRILKTGGYIIHLGPLQYHFDDITQQFSYEEFCQQFEQAGFNIELKESFTPQPFHRTGALTINQQYIDQLIIIKQND